MSRHVGGALLLIIVILVFAVAIRQDPGYVLINWGNTSVELSLVLAAALWLFSLWFMVRLIAFERWLLRSWRRDWSGFWGLGKRKAAINSVKNAEKTGNPASKA